MNTISENQFYSLLSLKLSGDASKEELELLRTLYLANTGQVDIAQHFPDRTWKSIGHQLTKVSGGIYRVGRCIIKTNQTYHQYAPTDVASECGSES